MSRFFLAWAGKNLSIIKTESYLRKGISGFVTIMITLLLSIPRHRLTSSKAKVFLYYDNDNCSVIIIDIAPWVFIGGGGRVFLRNNNNVTAVGA
jgi:hypothetical protein